MILYDKKCNLLGMSRDVLGFLGYEDIEEFKTYTNDVADLFVNKSGYVYKFKNFSWIDYILHSGAPNKSALVKLKNGKEVESRIAIEEILLIDPLGDNQTLYKVDLFNSYFGEHANHSLQGSIANIASLHVATQTPPEEKMETPEEDIPPMDIEPEVPAFTPPFTEDMEEEEVKEEEVSFDNNDTLTIAQDYEDVLTDISTDYKEEEPVQKLKIDDSIFSSMHDEEDIEKEEEPTLSNKNNDVPTFETTSFHDTVFDHAEEDEPVSFNQKLPLDDFDISLTNESTEESETVLKDDPFATDEESPSTFVSFNETTHLTVQESEEEIDALDSKVLLKEHPLLEESEEDVPSIHIKNDLMPDLIDDLDESIEDTTDTPLIDQAVEALESQWNLDEAPVLIKESTKPPHPIKEDRTYLEDFSETDIFGTYDDDLNNETFDTQKASFDTYEEETFDSDLEPIVKEESVIESINHPSYLDDAADILGIDKETLTDLMKEYLDHIDIVSLALEDALMQHDEKTTKELIEQLQGVADNLRITPLSTILEQLALATPETSPAIFTQYQEIIHSLKEEIA